MTLNRWQHATLSLLILLGLILLIVFACIRPAVSYYQERQTELATQQDRLQRYRAIAAQKDKLIPFYKEQQNKTIDQQHFLTQMEPSLAAAKLQEKIKILLTEHQGQLISTQPVLAKSDDAFTPIMIRVNMKSDINALLHVLYSLESNHPLAYIDNLQIQRTGARRNNNQRRTNTDISPLNTRFDLKVYMLNGKVES